MLMMIYSWNSTKGDHHFGAQAVCLAHLSFSQINVGVTSLVAKHNLGNSDKHKGGSH